MYTEKPPTLTATSITTHKRSVVSTLLSRASTHSSTTEAETEDEHVTSALRHNSYPTPIIKQQASQWHQEPELAEETRWYASTIAPYVWGVSEAIWGTYWRSMSATGHIEHFDRLKDLIPDLEKSGVVYQVPWHLVFCFVHRPGWNNRSKKTEEW